MIKETARINEYYQALVERNSQYLGVFVVGVKTTGVFCLPTCRARKPKLSNVSFYKNNDEATHDGYRPCKVCKPLDPVGHIPEDIEKALQMINNGVHQKIKDEDLKKAGLSPSRIRRWFIEHYKMTFHAYQRMHKIEIAYERIKEGDPVTSSAFGTGYESLSGFNHTFKNLLDINPNKAKQLNLIYLHQFSTPLGPMFAGATEKGLCLLEFADRKMLPTELKELTQKLRSKIIVGRNQHTEIAQTQINEYFQGIREQFDLSLDAPGTEFQQKVWQYLLQLPFGSTTTYKEMATALDIPKSVRAVANANGHNRISIIIPCHRVIGTNGHLTGYGGGLPRKEWLLEHESNTSF